MKRFNITDRKDFMSKLLSSDCFDSFLLQEASIKTANSYVIDGTENKDFYTNEDRQDASCCPYEYAEWKNMRMLCFQLIKGKRTPLSFQFVMSLKPDARDALLDQAGIDKTNSLVSHFIMNIRFEQSCLSITSAVSYLSFTLSKDSELLWDKTLGQFLSKKQISFDCD